MLPLQESIDKLALITDPERIILNKTKHMPSIEALNNIVDLSPLEKMVNFAKTEKKKL